MRCTEIVGLPGCKTLVTTAVGNFVTTYHEELKTADIVTATHDVELNAAG